MLCLLILQRYTVIISLLAFFPSKTTTITEKKNLHIILTTADSGSIILVNYT